MKNTELIEQLESLKVERNKYRTFESYEHILNWADKVYPLLKHNNSLYSEFKTLYDPISSDEELDRSLRYPTINKMIGVVDRAVGELKTSPKNTKRGKNTDGHEWYQKPIGILILMVVGGVLVTIIVFIIKHFSGLDL